MRKFLYYTRTPTLDGHKEQNRKGGGLKGFKVMMTPFKREEVPDQSASPGWGLLKELTSVTQHHQCHLNA